MARRYWFAGMLFVAVLLCAAILTDTHVAQVRPGPAGSAEVAQSAGTWSLGPEYELSPSYQSPLVDCDRYQPAVAYNSKNNQFLVAWHELLQGTGSQLMMIGTSADGKPLADHSYSLQGNSMGSGYRIEQAAAVYNANADEYFVVHMQEVDDPDSGVKQFQLWAKRLGSDFSSRANRSRIFAWPYRNFQTPRVAWNSTRNEYMVVWTALNTAVDPPQVNDVAGVRVGADGYPVSALASFISISSFPQQIDIAYDADSDRYLCVWRRLFAGSDWDLDGAYISGATGTLIDPPGIFIVSNAAGDQQHPSVAANGTGRFLVAWEQWAGGQADIYRMVLNSNGGVVEPVSAISQSSNDDLYPRTAFRAANNQRNVVWQRGATTRDIAGLSQGDTGPDLGRQFLSIGYFNWDCTRPVIGAGQRRYLVVYESDVPTVPSIKQHIYARSWGPNDLFLPAISK